MTQDFPLSSTQALRYLLRSGGTEVVGSNGCRIRHRASRLERADAQGRWKECDYFDLNASYRATGEVFVQADLDKVLSSHGITPIQLIDFMKVRYATGVPIEIGDEE